MLILQCAVEGWSAKSHSINFGPLHMFSLPLLVVTWNLNEPKRRLNAPVDDAGIAGVVHEAGAGVERDGYPELVVVDDRAAVHVVHGRRCRGLADLETVKRA